MSRTTRVFLPVLMLILVGGLITAWSSNSDVILPSAPELLPGSLSDEEILYVEYMYPRLQAFDRELGGIRDLVTTKSRNLIALQGYNNRLRNLLETTDTWLESNPTPEGFEHITDEFQAASVELTAILDDAESSLLSFDFSGVSGLIPRFDAVRETVQNLTNELEPSVGTGDKGVQ